MSCAIVLIIAITNAVSIVPDTLFCLITFTHKDYQGALLRDIKAKRPLGALVLYIWRKR
jgi:hypothetical protein